MRKVIENGYIIALANGQKGVEITENEFNEIIKKINNKPAAEDGFGWRLKEDLTWELYELPIAEEQLQEEISDSEALDIITGGNNG